MCGNCDGKWHDNRRGWGSRMQYTHTHSGDEGAHSRTRTSFYRLRILRFILLSHRWPTKKKETRQKLFLDDRIFFFILYFWLVVAHHCFSVYFSFASFDIEFFMLSEMHAVFVAWYTLSFAFHDDAERHRRAERVQDFQSWMSNHGLSRHPNYVTCV